ncbi:hypothetical protein BOX15_Mlig028386g2 [Macrostomum lignano]|uniref:Fibrous sheath-interacting protein 1 n=4 Tax=Macrostomum lignano TaxID=282301 RepID=A0A1I8H1X7_9PLAT|nr:hypothetical protein BOX15_Mlig028386g2 [Macrostomum lignano]
MQREDTDVSEASTDRTLELQSATPRQQQAKPNGTAPDSATADVTSDEENEIIQELKEEIKRKVREDIKDELARYDLKNLSSRTESAASSARDQSDPNGLLPERDAKYTEAYQRMLKLDKILRKRMAKEREVKRQRIMLEKRIKEELEQLRTEATSRRTNDEMSNTMKFLALTPSDGGTRRDGDSALQDEYSDELPHEPVFPTEYLFDEAQESAGANEEGTEVGGGTARSGKTSRKQQQQKDGRKKQAAGSGAAASGDSSKDFIKRNIELAAASNDVVAMTPEERERLDSLLRDLDSIPDLPEEFTDSSSGYQLAELSPGEGYRVSDADSRRLREIEASLARLGSVPPPALTAWSEESPSSARRQSELSDAYRATALQRAAAGQDWDLDRLGEKALAEVKEERLMSHRLEELNSRLSLISNESSQGPLSAEAMSALLSDCSRSIAASHSVRDANSQLGSHRSLQSTASAAGPASAASETGGDVDSLSSARLPDDEASRELAIQVPPLDRAVLDRLLADARAAGIGQNWARPEPITEEEEEEGEADAQTVRGSSSLRNGVGLDSSSDDDEACDDEACDDEDGGERLVLPDISLYANMSAPKTPNSGRYSAG